MPTLALQGSFQGARLAALNALSADARCAIKARHVAALGPPVNLLVKVGARLGARAGGPAVLCISAEPGQ